MADNIISSAFDSFRWYPPTTDNNHRTIEDNEKNKSDPAAKQKIIAGISGIGTEVPKIAPNNFFGACMFSFKADGLRVPNDLKNDITRHARVKNLTEDFDNIGFAVVSGFKHGCFFYVDADRQYAGGSIGGISLLGSDEHNTFLSAVISTQPYEYDPDTTVPSLSDEPAHIDTEASHFLMNIGGRNFSLGAEYAKHFALIDDVKVANSEEWKAHLEIEDIEKLFKSDTDLSLGLGASASNKGEYTIHLDSGTIRLTIKWDKAGRYMLEPFIQGGLSF